MKQAEVRGQSSRSVPVVAFETWRTVTDRSHGVAKEHTRKKEEPLDGNTVGLRAQESVNVEPVPKAGVFQSGRFSREVSEIFERHDGLLLAA